jgi:hypothetical protein
MKLALLVWWIWLLSGIQQQTMMYQTSLQGIAVTVNPKYETVRETSLHIIHVYIYSFTMSPVTRTAQDQMAEQELIMNSKYARMGRHETK